jgi:hypothetical protein
MKYFLILIIATSCTSIGYNLVVREAVHVRKIPTRHGVVECYTDSVDVRFEGQRFHLHSRKLNLDLHAVTLTLQDPNLYTAMDQLGSGNTIYHYQYRGRLFMQITDVPKGFTSSPDSVEYVWTITTDKICAN